MKIALMLVALGIGTGACAADSTAPRQKPSSLLAVSPNNAQATAVVRGTILGLRLLNPSDTTSYEHVAGASVLVYLEYTRLPVDSSQGPSLHQLLGNLTSDANGHFELTNVPDGVYGLTVTPPPGSPYAPAPNDYFAFQSTTQNAPLIWLSLK